MEIKAKLIEKYETKTFGESGFKKREFVVEYAENPEYPEFIKIELVQDKCDELDKFNIGDEIDISLNLRGRKWTDPKGEVVYFNSLQAWKIKGGTQPHDINDQTQESETPEWMNQDKGNDSEPLPF